MNERKLLTLRFLFRAIRFRPGCRRNGRMRWPRRNHYPAYLAIGIAYARISRQRSSGGFRWIRRDVNLSGRHALLFPDCSDMRTPKPFARLSSSHRKILFFPHSPFFSPFSFFFRAILSERISVPSCILSVSVDWKPLLLRRPWSVEFQFQLPALFRGSGTGHLSWFRTDCAAGSRVIRISAERITRGDKVRSDDYTVGARLVLTFVWFLLRVKRYLAVVEIAFALIFLRVNC